MGFVSPKGAAVFAAAASMCLSAAAHVTLEYQVAPAGSSYKASFRVGHGCDASPTRQVSVAIPAGVRGARPMPKAGWAVEIVRGQLAQPYTSHGKAVTEDVTRITWTAKTRDDMLPPTHYDEFVIAATVPDKPGPIYWPVSQVCEQGRLDWTEIPAAGQKLHDLKSPAAVLEILPAGGAAGHPH